MDDELFTESSDKIRQIVQEEMAKKKLDNSDDESGLEALCTTCDELVGAFKDHGFSRKEAVYLSGQILGQYIGSLANVYNLGGLLS